MATIKTNVLLKGLSGKFGNIVFRTVGDKTIVSPRRSRSNKKKETDAQRNTRSTFKEATAWAKTAMRDPDKKAYYQERAIALQLSNAYTAAITDYMRKPKGPATKHRDVMPVTTSETNAKLSSTCM